MATDAMRYIQWACQALLSLDSGDIDEGSLNFISLYVDQIKGEVERLWPEADSSSDDSPGELLDKTRAAYRRLKEPQPRSV